MRALGLDLGDVRIGVAISDADGTVATPIETIKRARKWHVDHGAIAHLVAEWEAEIVVVGLPLSLDGTEGPAVRKVKKELGHLRDTLAVPVETYDERLSTVTAERALKEQNLRAQERRAVIDQVAAAVILQAWLDHRRSADQTDTSDD